MSPLLMSSDQSNDSVSSDPTRFSTNLNSLRSFLEEIDDTSSREEERAICGVSSIREEIDDTSSREEERAIRGVSSTRVPLACHAEKNVDGSNNPTSSNPLIFREKKYIWDDWDEGIHDVFQQKKYIWDDDEMAMLDEENKCLWDDWERTAEDVDVQLKNDENPKEAKGEIVKAEISVATDAQSKRCPVDARQQLQLLKSMSVEIQTRADAMKIQLEQKIREVEELHSIRVKNESNHAFKMISVRQEWKQRIQDVNAEHEKFMSSQDNLRESLKKDCETMEKQVASIQAEIARVVQSQNESCNRLRVDGKRDLEDTRRIWQQAEKDELKKRDHKLSIKLKKDAAKLVEPKLRQLVERNKEEIERMEREAERELEFYKLELYKRSNDEFRKELNKIRDDERSRISNLENDWMAKMETVRREHEHELKKVRDEFEERADVLKRHLLANKQRIMDEHQAAVTEAQMAVGVELERVRDHHEQEMADLEEEYKIKMTQQKKKSEAEFKLWQVQRNSELQVDEEMKLKQEYEKVKSRFQSDIDLVKQKLAEEKGKQSCRRSVK